MDLLLLRSGAHAPVSKAAFGEQLITHPWVVVGHELNGLVKAHVIHLENAGGASIPEPPIKIDDETVGLLSKANRNIGILEGLSRQIPSIELLVSMCVRKEALLSSQIEGAQATLDDILDPRVEENTNRHVADVVNHVKVSQYAKARLKELPICNRLIEETHKVLQQNVRGEEKHLGESRRSQNWLGPTGSTFSFELPSEVYMELPEGTHATKKSMIVIKSTGQ